MGASIHYTAIDVAEEQLAAFFYNYKLEGWPEIKTLFTPLGLC
jgi:hypothetical protein